MQTTKRTRGWGPARRRRHLDGQSGPSRDLHAEISPVWELQPRGHEEVGARAVVRRRDSQLRRALACVDVVAVFLALLAATALDGSGSVQLRLGAALLIPFVLLAGKTIGLYDRDQHVVRKTTVDELPSILYLAVVSTLAIWLGEGLLLRGYLQRPEVFGLLAATFLLTAVGRLLVRKIAFSITKPERCIVIGNPADASRIAAKFTASPGVNATIIGRVGLHPGADGRSVSSAPPSLGSYDQLSHIVATNEVERVIIASHSDAQEEILDAIRLIKALGVKVSVLPRLLEVVGSASSWDEIDGIWLLGVRHFGLARSSEFLKRAMDIAAAGLGLLVLGPLFLMLMAAVRLDSAGPVFFRQPRIGRRGEPFWMLKFRSMVPGADGMKKELESLNEAPGGLFKIAEDPRITRVGRFLRRTSLDELPQLLNVLRGDMSLVGPRPLIPDEDALIEGWERRRLAVKPGMTGLWQIFGSSRIPMHEMVKIDYIYGANWSLWLDLRILLRTVPYVLSRRGR